MPPELNAEIIPVIVVPIFAPKHSGNILSSSTVPRATKGINIDMNTELL